MSYPVAEWVAKAEGDFITAGREIRARKAPNHDAVCFHCQQCAEKYLKAFCNYSGISFVTVPAGYPNGVHVNPCLSS